MLDRNPDNFQRDGLMQTMVPKGRANYEPNSLSQAGEDGGPRASDEGFATHAKLAAPTAEKRHVRTDSFADHFSQACMFYRSQTEVEQTHIAAALVFELSKVKLNHVRICVLSQLRNIDETLAQTVADDLALPLPAAMAAAKAPIDLDSSDALSILKQKPVVKGHTLAILVTDGADDAVLEGLIVASKKAWVAVKIVAPKVGGVTTKGGVQMPADEMIAGAPSVLFDAVALVASDDGVTALLKDKAALDFVSDAFAHHKAIGHTPAAQSLLDAIGVAADDWFCALPKECATLVEKLPLRLWDRGNRSV